MFLILASICAALLLGYFIKCFAEGMSSRLPPGPWGLPVVGYAPFLSVSSHFDYVRLQKKYGNVFGFNNGSCYTVILGDYASIKEAYNKSELLDRPPGIFSLSTEYQHVGIMNGPVWKETRRFVLTTLRNLGMGKNKLEERIKEELMSDLDKIANIPPGTEVNTHDIFYRLLINIMFSIICGKTFDDSSAIVSLVEKYNRSVFNDMESTANELYYPFLKPFLALKRAFVGKRNVDGFEEIENFLWNEIDEHTKDFDENIKEDFFDYFIEEMKKREGQPTPYTRGNMNGNGQALLLAGTDTVRSSLDWIFLCLAKYQDEQDKVYNEIHNLLGQEKAPSWSDRESLPLVSAFIMEVARFKTLSPASDPHWSSENSTVNGFEIPSHSILIANVYAVHNDTSLWGDPENFRPERFLSPDRKKAVQPEYWIPFMAGKRSCPGEKLARMQLFLVMTSMVQKFKVLPPESGLCLDEVDGLLLYAVKPVVSLQLRT